MLMYSEKIPTPRRCFLQQPNCGDKFLEQILGPGRRETGRAPRAMEDMGPQMPLKENL